MTLNTPQLIEFSNLTNLLHNFNVTVILTKDRGTPDITAKIYFSSDISIEQSYTTAESLLAYLEGMADALDLATDRTAITTGH